MSRAKFCGMARTCHLHPFASWSIRGSILSISILPLQESRHPEKHYPSLSEDHCTQANSCFPPGIQCGDEFMSLGCRLQYPRCVLKILRQISFLQHEIHSVFSLFFAGFLLSWHWFQCYITFCLCDCTQITLYSLFGHEFKVLGSQNSMQSLSTLAFPFPKLHHSHPFLCLPLVADRIQHSSTSSPQTPSFSGGLWVDAMRCAIARSVDHRRSRAFTPSEFTAAMKKRPLVIKPRGGRSRWFSKIRWIFSASSCGLPWSPVFPCFSCVSALELSS